MTTKTIDGKKYLMMVSQGAHTLSDNKNTINDLNVFPIPDGDTGDNMYMTIAAGCNYVKEKVEIVETSEVVAKGMLLGARGNSGVILSRIFAGIAKGIAGIGKKEFDVDDFAQALQAGVKESYSAVSVPVEGTILTVFKDAVRVSSLSGSKDFESFFDVLVKEMEASLERTPELLPVLKEAGVVDSGGAGILCIFRGMADALSVDSVEDLSGDAPSAPSVKINLDAFTSESELTFGYCTEFILRLQSSKVNLDSFDEAVIKDYLNSVGDSVVCFRDGTIVKAHVHTKKPGDILNHCQTWGEYLTIKIENMTLQHHEAKIENNFKISNSKKYGVVTVASGEGLVNMLKEAGADVVIEGGQTMNPSAGSFIEAFDSLGAETVFVFPNNSNIILTANQAAELYKKSRIVVLPSKDVGQGYVAIASMDFSKKSAEEIADAAKEAMANVCTGMVSKAIRDTQKDGVGVKEGHYIGFTHSTIHCDSEKKNEAASMLCDRLSVSDHDVALILKGVEASQSELDDLIKDLQKKYPRTEFIPSDAGQGVYDYIIVLC